MSAPKPELTAELRAVIEKHLSYFPEWMRRTIRTFAENLVREVVVRKSAELAKEMAAVRDIKNVVHETLISFLGVDDEELSPHAELVNDLGADSLDVVELTIAFEDAFDIEIPDEDVMKVKTVQDIIDYLTLRTARFVKS